MGLGKLSDDRTDAGGEMRPAHAYRISVGARVEDNLVGCRQRDVHKHGLTVKGTQGWHRTRLAVRKQLLQLDFISEADAAAAGEHTQPVEIHR